MCTSMQLCACIAGCVLMLGMIVGTNNNMLNFYSDSFPIIIGRLKARTKKRKKINKK